jgi:hypothetical protein
MPSTSAFATCASARTVSAGPAHVAQYQDRADALRGCWRYGVNLHVGFGVLQADIARSGAYCAFWSYGGSESYAKQVMPRVENWQMILAAGTPVSDFLGLCLRRAKSPAGDPDLRRRSTAAGSWRGRSGAGRVIPAGRASAASGVQRARHAHPAARRGVRDPRRAPLSPPTRRTATSRCRSERLDDRGGAGRSLLRQRLPADRRGWTYAAYVPGLRYG